MGHRRKAREETLRILFQIEFEDAEFDTIVAQYWENREIHEEIKEYSTWLVSGIISHKGEIDDTIQSVSEHWRISRMALVDRNILRMAVFEILYEENIDTAVVINEAIEIARKYSGNEAAAFVNGILDGARKKLEKAKKPLKEEEHG
ncbi:MAG: transcription antitermination factor NusB [Candidatus Aminicenantes bacterium]|nr:transcription antitermination factor NusB [Candidatus Aminicenantes bacterium]